jgi:hypothetical protein
MGRPVRTLYVLPSIPDELDEELKNGLAIRNACATGGRCPVCGVTPELHVDRAGIHHLVFCHEDGCPVTRDPYDWRELFDVGEGDR